LDGKIGVAFIMSIEKFDNYPNEFRHGGPADQKNLISTLRELKFEVNVVNTSDDGVNNGRYTEKDIQTWIKDKVDSDLTFQHCIVMFFLLSHGENDCTFLTSDNKKLCFRTEILEPLQKSLYFSNALKIFVLNSCRTANDVATFRENRNVPDVSKHTIFIQSSLSNEGSRRSETVGSQFIYYFVKVLKKHHKSVDFLQMISFINSTMSEQSCVVSCSLNGPLFLFPNVCN
jgi:hypothetical protein